VTARRWLSSGYAYLLYAKMMVLEEDLVEYIESVGEDALVKLSRQELAFISNAITESFLAIEEWEYGTLLALDMTEAEGLRTQVNEVLDRLRAP
jgi:hypothetical protein